jgi:hypothetical protein
MWTFLIGAICAAALAVLSVLGLNAMDQSTPDAFYTRYTIESD